MITGIAWLVWALGIGHVAVGLRTFRAPLAEVVAGGFVGQFQRAEIRRTAFWFVIFGPLLMLAGHTAIHAVAVADLALLRLVGSYLLVTSAIGAAAFPKSPFIVALAVSPLLIAAGCGWLTV